MHTVVIVNGRFRSGSTRLSGLSHQVNAYSLPQSCNLEGMSMNIQRKNSAYNFRMQSDWKQTLVIIFFNVLNLTHLFLIKQQQK